MSSSSRSSRLLFGLLLLENPLFFLLFGSFLWDERDIWGRKSGRGERISDPGSDDGPTISEERPGCPQRSSVSDSVHYWGPRSSLLIISKPKYRGRGWSSLSSNSRATRLKVGVCWVCCFARHQLNVGRHKCTPFSIENAIFVDGTNGVSLQAQAGEICLYSV